LPSKEGACGGGIYGMHIHEGSLCSVNEKDPFADAGSHYNPKKCPHPYHAGDLPPLFADNGYAWFSFLTQRFDVNEVIEKTVIIHSQPDDFTTQPSGNSGAKIACGVITPVSEK
jgi:Cu-Zn family superoxide dismutase